MKRFNGIELALEVLETTDHDYAGNVLWNYTGWPCFFDFDNPEQQCREQLQAFRDNPQAVIDESERLLGL